MVFGGDRGLRWRNSRPRLCSGGLGIIGEVGIENKSGGPTDPPSGRVLEQGPDWFLVATEACGGGPPDLCYFLEVSVFIGIFGLGNKSGGSLVNRLLPKII